MARRFCFPDWPGSDGDSVTIGQPINGVDGPMWPYSGSVYKTLAATYATGGHELFLPYGYRLTTGAGGIWLGTLNAIEAASGELIIRGYDAGQGARDPVAEAAARARIRRAAYWFDETEFRAGAADFWAAMHYPVIDMGFYPVTGDWTHIGSNVWRMIQAWKPGTAGAPGAYLMLTGASAPTNKVADMTWGTVRQQAYTQAGMKLAPNYAIEGEGIWHSYRSDADGTANASGNFTTVLVTTAGSDAANNPVTYYGGLCFVWQTAEGVILFRNGGQGDIEDVCLAHVRKGVMAGDYTAATLNGAIKLSRMHVITPWARAYHVNYNGDLVAHCGAVTMLDCSFDTRGHSEITYNADTGDEPRSWGSFEGFSFEFRAANVVMRGGWSIGGQHNALACQGAGSGTDAREPNNCSVTDMSLMGSDAGQGRLWSLGGWGNTFDAIWAFNGTTRSQFTVNGDAAGRVNTIRNVRMGAYRANIVTPNETWTIAQLTTSSSPTPPGGTVTTPANNGTIRLQNCLFDTSNAVAGGLGRFGIALVCTNVDELVGANGVEMDGVTLKVSPNQACALRVVHRENSDTVGIDRSQTFKHLRIVQESGTPIPQVGFQKNKSSSSGTLDSTSTLAAHFNGAAAVLHQVKQGTAAAIDAGGCKGATFDPAEEPQQTPFAGVVGDNWNSDQNPEFAWAQTRNANFEGNEDLLRYFSQFAATEPTLVFADLEDPPSTQGGGKLVTSATEIRRLPGNYVVCRRIDCPSGVAGRKAFEHVLDLAQIGAGWSQGNKLRSLLGQRTQSAVPFDTEFWAVLGVWIPPAMLLGSNASGYYFHIGQCHEGANDLINNATMSFDLQGGNGVASAARVVWDVKRYKNANGGWPSGPLVEEDQPGTLVHEQSIIEAPAPNIYHHLILNARIEPGYADPTYGNIYGGVEANGDTPKGFARMYYALGETDQPVLVGEYRGWLGSPWIPALVDPDNVQMFLGRRRFMRGPDLHAGIYSKHTFQPAAFGTVQSIINRGWRVWLAERNPGMTAASALREYRQP